MAKINGKPPTTLTVTKEVIAERPKVMLFPKLAGKALSIPKVLLRELVKSIKWILTLEIFAKSVKQAATVDGVMESCVGKQNSLEKPLVQYSRGADGPTVEHEPSQ